MKQMIEDAKEALRTSRMSVNQAVEVWGRDVVAAAQAGMQEEASAE